jgi:hypothetical protein
MTKLKTPINPSPQLGGEGEGEGHSNFEIHLIFACLPDRQGF